MIKTVLLISILFSSFFVFAQGEIDVIKKQPYMQRASQVNCDSIDGDNLSAKICANLRFQKADSILTTVYQAVLKSEQTDSAKKYIVDLQKDWRLFRDHHCSIIWRKYEGVGVQGEVYLNCLTDLTQHRIDELRILLKHDE